MDEVAAKLAKSGPTSSVIADWIRSQIRASRLVPGQRLVEVDIIRQTGGSRFKVREAFQRLAAEGLVEIEEYRGASVRGATEDEVRQLYQARALLEGLCARDFTLKAGEADRERLGALALEMEECIDQQSPERFSRLNADWHTLLMRGANNAIIEDLVKRLSTPVHHLLFGTFYRGERLRQAVDDHRAIMDAIDAGDAAGAEMAMRKHVEHGHEFLTHLDRTVHDA